MAILRISKKINYTTIENETIRDKKLSRQARGLLVFMLSQNDKRDFNDLFLIGSSEKDGKTVLENIKKELKTHGYLIIKEVRIAGKISHERNIYETPYTGLPHTGKPSTVQPCTVNTGYKKEHNKNTNKEINNKPKGLLQKKDFIGKIRPLVEGKVLDGYDEKDLREQAKLCWMYHEEKKGIKIASTTYNNRIINAIKYERLTKKKRKMQYETLDD